MCEKESHEWKPSGSGASVRYISRFEKAKEQADLKPLELCDVIEHVNDCLSELDIAVVEDPVVILNDSSTNDKLEMEKSEYDKIPSYSKLKDEKDIVWIKFTKGRHLGVVATSNDINFNFPKSKCDYVKKEYLTSGIIVHRLGEEWDMSFILVFPLIGLSKTKKRKCVEYKIGNYLIDKKVPILDYYSHRYMVNCPGEGNCTICQS